MIFVSGVAGHPRSNDLSELYASLGELRDANNGPYYLSEYDGGLDWPERGIYFFFSHDSDLEHQPPEQWHLTRIGTVGVSEGSSNTLKDRLRQHRGSLSGKYGDNGGNHRGSIFRRHVGRAIIERDELHDTYPNWGVAHRNLPADVETANIRTQEHPLEQRVSTYIRGLPFLILDVPGEPNGTCDRARIEKNLIGLISHHRRTTPELMKDGWLGHNSPVAEIHRTGLWNIDYANAFYSQNIIQNLDTFITSTGDIRDG